MREATHLSIGPCRAREIEKRERMRVACSGLDAEVSKQMLANEMGRLAPRVGQTEVNAGLAEVDRQELRMTIGEMQDADIADRRQRVVELCSGG